MYRRNLQKFFLSIVVPTILAILLFVAAIYAIIIPVFEQNMMDRKKEMISELTNTAWSLLEEYNNETKQGNISIEEAKKHAALRIKKLRYGAEQKDYFWIIDMRPIMIMHPYREDLNGKNLSDYKDPNGKKLFVEAVNTVRNEGEGFINYFWQWKDDNAHIVPKLSYVKEYSDWGWIVGTGIYLEDVRLEIRQLKQRLLKISFFITLFIALTLFYIVRQSLRIEKERNEAGQKLMLSRQKYKSLVEASTEGTLMIIDNKIIFSNFKFQALSGFSSDELQVMQLDDLYATTLKDIILLFKDPQKSVTLETSLKCKSNVEKDIVISISQVKQSHRDGFIIINKDVTRTNRLEIETERLSGELQTSLLLMTQPIKNFIKDIIKCDISSSIGEVSAYMTRKKKDLAVITAHEQVAGVVHESDLKERALAKQLPYTNQIVEIMSSPAQYIYEDALLYEAILKFQKENITHLLVRNSLAEVLGMVSKSDLFEMQGNVVGYILKEIETTEDVRQIESVYQKVPVLVKALLDSGDKTENITHIITSVSDAISKRIIELAIESVGQPPCNFAFIAMGSEGRMEQTLNTDQDNAIIFENIQGEKRQAMLAYFQKLGETVNKHLGIVGYKLCKGNNMAGNPKWSQPLSVWENYFTGWVQNSDPQSILDASIFFDFRCVYGEQSMVDKLRDHMYQSMSNKAVFFHHMASSVLKFKPPLSMFGNIIGEQTDSEHKRIDIKKILLPVTGILRIYALQNKLIETNSMQRLRRLTLLNVFTKEMYNELALLYNYLMRLRLKSQATDLESNNQLDNMLDVNSLTEIELATLRKIFSEINNLETKLGFDFKATV